MVKTFSHAIICQAKLRRPLFFGQNYKCHYFSGKIAHAVIYQAKLHMPLFVGQNHTCHYLPGKISNLKMRYLREMTKIFSKETMESHLNSEQRAASRAFEVLAEDSLFSTVKYLRYVEQVDAVADQLPDRAFGFWTPFWKFLLKRSIPKAVCILRVT